MKFKKFFPKLSFQAFALILEQSLHQSQLTDFCSRLGMEVPGYRLEKIPTIELVGYLFEDCRTISTLPENLEKLLDKANGEIAASFRSGSVSSVKKVLENWGELMDEGELGAYLWAAFRDQRAAVNRVAVKICRQFDKMVDKVSASIEEEAEYESQPPLPEIPPRGEVIGDDNREDGEEDEDAREMLDGFRRIKKLWDDELKSLEKHLKKLSSETKKAKRQAEKHRDEARERAEEIAELRKELKEWKQRYAALEKDAASKKKTADDSRLRSRLNSLERELRKKEYELRQNEKKMERLPDLEIEGKKAQASLDQSLREVERAREREEGLREKVDVLRGEIKALKDANKPTPSKPPPPPGKERLGIFLDSRNIYHTVHATYSGARIDFDELFTRISRGRKVVRAIAYVVEADFSNKEGFFNMLKFKGFQVKRRPLKIRANRSMKGDWDMGMALDLIKYAGDLDTIALVSGDGDFYDLLVYLKNKDVKVEVYGVEMSTALDLKRTADLYVPIDSDWLLQ
ncbi:MAG: NYN domain-containing protein [Candidatus Euphemobacter frigidus]|nr:NYN domain-containing protein [Candidatus Euphemobacter frigidus]MDP8276639.1 NYN domain-containing protein [Candidatus Euphemobacter frigidus]